MYSQEFDLILAYLRPSKNVDPILRVTMCSACMWMYVFVCAVSVPVYALYMHVCLGVYVHVYLCVYVYVSCWNVYCCC